MTELYGIANCDTVRKARRWLDEHGVAYRFHDYRKDGLSRDMLVLWVDRLGWETLLNRRGTTWRQLPEADRQGLDGERAIELMLLHPALIRRPLLSMTARSHLETGFSADRYSELFQ
ncbi:ArsC family reductase [Mariprofundus erugo]|uniref:ArsC family reductase n=1 Tax=Mariprofundus erugo TaxID=2528639 RepID=UPI0010FEF06D|nr:ArsC family reductase [Mariprofundus erugo]TLS75030.1 ArsC family reductase [Mariprofundus erugo]